MDAGTSTDLSDPTVPVRCHLESVMVVVLTSALLCCLKFSVFYMLRRCNSYHIPTCARVEEQLVGHIKRCPCLQYDRRPWYYSDMVCDMMVCPGLLGAGCYLLHGTDLLNTPFMGEEAFDSSKLFLCVAVGALCYRFVRLSVGPQIEWRCTIQHVTVIVSLAMYAGILLTKQSTILGVIGMLSQVTSLFYTIRSTVKIYRVQGEHTTSKRRLHGVISGVHTAAILLFSVVMPVAYLSLAAVKQSVLLQSYVAISVFCFSVTYFGITGVSDLFSSLATTCRYSLSDTDSESTILLQSESRKTQNILPVHTNYTLNPEQLVIGEKPKKSEEAQPMVCLYMGRHPYS